MAESVHKSSEIPNLDTYPATPSDELIDYKGVERASISRAAIESSSLQQRAAELGAAAGRIALIMRETKENVENLAQRGIYDRVSRLAATARVRTESLHQRAGARVQEVTHTVQE